MTDQAATTPSFSEAYAGVLPEMQRLAVDDLLIINVDIPAAVMAALGAWPGISALRDRVQAALQTIDLERFDNIETYALAAGHAHALFMTASAPSSSMQELSEAASRTRETLLFGVRTLAQRGLADRDRLRELSGRKGYRNVAFDILALVALLRERWSSVEGRTAIQAVELDEAERLAQRLITAVGARAQAPAAVARAADLRQRAFTLFVRAYEQARRAIAFLRWSEDDVDRIAPSLYAGRNRRRSRADADTPAMPASQPIAVGIPGNDLLSN